MKIAIVHGNGDTAALIKQYAEKYCEANDIGAIVVSFGDGIDIASDYSADYDIIFLGTDAKLLNGFKTAEIIREKDKDAAIVFVSDDAATAVHGYAVEALGFLLEPFGYVEFEHEIARCVQRVRATRKRYILFSTENGMDRVAVDSIMYIESQDHRKEINTTDGVYFVYGTMDSLEERLPPDGFSRCNNSFLVNLAHVKGVHGEFVLIGGREIKITRSKRKNFMHDVERYFGIS